MLILAFFAFPNISQAQSTFNDTQGHIYEESVQFLADRGIVEGYDNGSYGVDLPINRAEIGKVVTLGSDKELVSSFNCFPDVLTEWFAIFVCTAKQLGIVSGHDDGLYRPAENVNFPEAFKMVTKAYGISLPNVSGEWFEPYVEYVHSEGIFTRGTYVLSDKMTRGEMAYLIHQVILRMEDEQPVSPSQPTEPTQPINPTEPVQPTEPTQPTEPSQPTEPTEPIQPTQPQGPVSSDLGDLTVDANRLPFINTMTDRPDTSDWTVVNYNGPQTGQGVYNAVQTLEPFSVLQLPNGVYSGPLDILGVDNVAVRGNCTDLSAVTWSHSGQPDNIIWADGPVCSPGWLRLCGGNYGESNSDIFGPTQAWSGPYTRGTTTLNVANASSFHPGQIVLIQSAPLSQPNTDIQTDRFTHMAEVLSVNGGSINIDSPLQIDFSNQNASVRHLPGVLRNSGIECVTMNQTDASDPANLYNQTVLVMGNVWNGWIYNVDLGDTFNNHAIVEGTGNSLITDTRFGHQMKSTRGDGSTCNANTSVENNPCWNKQAILYRESHNNAFVNNVIHSSIGVETAHSSSGNWFAYNYFPEPQFHPDGEPRRALFPHGNYAYANVFEGNMFWGDTQMDEVWGSQGPYYTWFRNTAFGGRNGEGVFFNEVWANNPNAFVVSRFTNYLLNYAGSFGFPGFDMDTRSENMLLERNVYTNNFIHGTHPTASGTTVSENQQGSPGSAWSGLDFPDTLNQSLNGVPEFWCSNTVSNGGPVCDFSIHGGVGALWNGSCILPAQARDEGLSCN